MDFLQEDSTEFYHLNKAHIYYYKSKECFLKKGWSRKSARFPELLSKENLEGNIIGTFRNINIY